MSYSATYQGTRLVVPGTVPLFKSFPNLEDILIRHFDPIFVSYCSLPVPL